MKSIFLSVALTFAVLTGHASPTSAMFSNVITGQASVIDGDTIEIHGERIRLNGIDAPESDQHCNAADGTAWRCGSESAFYLDDMIGQKPVSCEVSDQDRYGRFIANCFIDDWATNLNANLVEAGLAVAYRKYSQEYIAQEDAARAARRGIWNGEFMMPWDWRRK